MFSCIILHNIPNIALYWSFFFLLAIFDCCDHLYINLWKEGSFVARGRHPPRVIRGRVGNLVALNTNPRMGQGKLSQESRPGSEDSSHMWGWLRVPGSLHWHLGQFAGDGGAALRIAGTVASIVV